MKFDGEKLRKLRTDRKWDQHRLAEAARAHGVGITQSQISRYENGQEPSGRNLVAVAQALGVEPRELLDGSPDVDEEDALLPSHAEMLAALRPLARLVHALGVEA